MQNNCQKLKLNLQENWRLESGLTYDENFFPKCVKSSDMIRLENINSVGKIFFKYSEIQIVLINIKYSVILVSIYL